MNFPALADDSRPNRWLASAAAVILCVATALLLIITAAHDEVHFAHAAWNAQQGLRPFGDFLFHNSPAILYLLRVAGCWNPHFGPEVLWWGRALCIASLWSTAYLVYRIGRLLNAANVGLLALVLYVPLVVTPYDSGDLRKLHWMIRPEVYAMPLVLLSLHGLLALARQDARRERWTAGLEISLPAALALYLSPRVIFPCLGLLLTAIGIWRQRRLGWSVIGGWLCGAAVAPLLYALSPGFHDSFTWIGKYAGLLKEGERGWLHGYHIDPGRGILLVALACAVCRLLRSAEANWRYLALVFGASCLAALAEKETSLATWQFPLLFGSLLVADLLHRLVRREAGVNLIPWALLAVLAPLACESETWGHVFGWPLALAIIAGLLAWSLNVAPAFKQHRTLIVAAMLLCTAWLVPGRNFVRYNLRLASAGASRLSLQVAEKQRLCAALADETALFSPKDDPVAYRSASYFWTQYSGLARVLPAAGITQPPVDLAQDIREHRPAVLAAECLPNDDDELARWVDENYRRLEAGLDSANVYFIRGDRFDELLPLIGRRTPDQSATGRVEP